MIRSAEKTVKNIREVILTLVYVDGRRLLGLGLGVVGSFALATERFNFTIVHVLQMNLFKICSHILFVSSAFFVNVTPLVKLLVPRDFLTAKHHPVD